MAWDSTGSPGEGILSMGEWVTVRKEYKERKDREKITKGGLEKGKNEKVRMWEKEENESV